MASKTEIANRALSKLGDRRISNIETEDTTSSNTLNDMWNVIRDSMLASYPWNFAIERKQLPADATSPAWGYNKRYQLPSDFLALLEIKDEPDYKLEGQYILTNAGAPLYIKYIKRIENTGDFDPLFAEVMATRLAYEACEKITQSNTKKQILAAEYEQNLSDAYANDAIQDRPIALQESDWIVARYSGYYDYCTNELES